MNSEIAVPTSEIGSSARPDLPLAVVVGAGALGMAIARQLGQSARLLLVDRRLNRLEACVDSLTSFGYDARGFVCDIVDRDAVDGLAREVAASRSFKAVAHVVGLSPSMGDFRTIMTVNLIGATLIEDAMRRIATRSSAAMFVASVAAHSAPPDASLLPLLDDPLAEGFLDNIEAAIGEPATPLHAYRFSKHAIIRMCQRRAPSWGQRGARILSLSPGQIASPMGALEFRNQPEKYARFLKTPLQREATMIEIAAAAEFLLSDRASYITGTDLLVDGGAAAALRGA